MKLCEGRSAPGLSVWMMERSAPSRPPVVVHHGVMVGIEMMMGGSADADAVRLDLEASGMDGCRC